MGILDAYKPYDLVPPGIWPRVRRWLHPKKMKELFDEWYGEDKWCIAWDGAVERLARPGSKKDHAKAVEGVEEAWIGLEERGCVAPPERVDRRVAKSFPSRPQD